MCPLDKGCREVGAPPRLCVIAKRWAVTLALTREGRWVRASTPQGDPPYSTRWFEFRRT